MYTNSARIFLSMSTVLFYPCPCLFAFGHQSVVTFLSSYLEPLCLLIGIPELYCQSSTTAVLTQYLNSWCAHHLHQIIHLSQWFTLGYSAVLFSGFALLLKLEFLIWFSAWILHIVSHHLD